MVCAQMNYSKRILFNYLLLYDMNFCLNCGCSFCFLHLYLIPFSLMLQQLFVSNCQSMCAFVVVVDLFLLQPLFKIICNTCWRFYQLTKTHTGVLTFWYETGSIGWTTVFCFLYYYKPSEFSFKQCFDPVMQVFSVVKRDTAIYSLPKWECFY